jgi:ribosomal peptide maturation radical SAM protein 1
MPFADVERPALGVSLLKARIAAQGFCSRIIYCNLDLAERIGIDPYRRISDGFPADLLVGEWFFADLVFGSEIPPEYEYVDRVLGKAAPPPVVAAILSARRDRSAFVAECAAKVQADRPKIVAFTTTFHQTCAALALAKSLKTGPDPPIVIFGGGNCEGEMGRQLIDSVPWIDFVCTGEGDDIFPAFVAAILSGAEPAVTPGLSRRGGSPELTVPPTITDLDRLPYPDYGDYMARLRASPLGANMTPTLLFESARGCWWGAKQHCTFCGLNGQTMAFRSKSPARVFDEISTLSRTHGIKRLSAVDNILDTRHIRTLFPRLRDADLGLELFYEVKANLKFHEVALLRAGGVYAIQPGLESLSNDVLRLMKKGCTALHNIQLLRWCLELGITAAWNLLAGFPGENEQSFADMAELVPLLVHLTPPASCTPVRLDRFSPLFTHSAKMGLRRVRPAAAYYYVFPFDRRELERLAYFFDFDYADGRSPIRYLEPLQRSVGSWWEAHALPAAQRPRLDAEWFAPDELTVTDTRACARDKVQHFSGPEARIYAICDSYKSVVGIVRALDDGPMATPIQPILDAFVAHKLMVEIEDQYLSLAVIKNRSRMVEGGSDEDRRRHEAAAAEPLLSSV